MIEDGRIDPLPLITHRLHFKQLHKQLPMIHEQHGLVKAMIDFN